jgi:predicted ATPase
MKIDINVTNLGKIKDASFKIRPITLLTGPNGTGKSFFTKTLYSILNVININAYHLSLTKSIADSKLQLDSFKSTLNYPGAHDYKCLHNMISSLDTLQTLLNQATEIELNEYLNYSKSKGNLIDELLSSFDSYLVSLSEKPKKKSSVTATSKKVKTSLLTLKEKLEDGKNHYTSSLADNLTNEIKDNFQISNLLELVSFDEVVARINIDEIVRIEFGKSGVGFSLQHDFINKISSLSRVVFFESPAYWKVRDALKSAKERANFPFYVSGKNSNLLTGVPKYFYDLDDALKENVKNSNESEFEFLTESIKNELGGEFVFSGDNLVFKDHQSKKEISKNLISFGMTNLGMIHALLNNNVITPGSFVFIDEPETNLHPRWQVLLMNSLIELADNNINIVIATHSIDMLKALEVGLKERKTSNKDDFMSTHYLDIDGQLLEFGHPSYYLQSSSHFLFAKIGTQL